LAVASEVSFAKLWNTSDLAAGGKPPPPTNLGLFTIAQHSVAFSPNSRRLATGRAGRDAVELYDVKSGHELLTLGGTDSPASFKRTRFSPDGAVLASCNIEELHLWRAPSWREIEAAEANLKQSSTHLGSDSSDRARAMYAEGQQGSAPAHPARDIGAGLP
jgi:WD40 repeat protein